MPDVHPTQSFTSLCRLQNKRENPIHIINVSIKTADTEDDDALVTALTAFAQSKVSLLIQFYNGSSYCGHVADFLST